MTLQTEQPSRLYGLATRLAAIREGATMTISLGLALPVQKTYSIGRDVPAVANAAEEIDA
jgi:hypothetical protein